MLAALYKVKLRLMGMSLVLQVFYRKAKHWINWSSDVTVALL